MRKQILITIAFLLLHSTFAQHPLNVFKKNLSVINLETTEIDSITFNQSSNGLTIFKKNSTQNAVTIADVDSMNFNPLFMQLPPIVEAPQLSDIQYTTVKTTFRITSIGGTSVTESGICWSTSENPTMDNQKEKLTVLMSAGQITLTELTPSTKYYARTYAINSAGITYSNQVQFNTSAIKAPTVETVSVKFNENTAKITCLVNVTDDGGCPLTDRGICWSIKKDPTLSDSVSSYGTATGKFYGVTPALPSAAKYYVRSYATNCIGTTYGNELSIEIITGNVRYTLDQSVKDAGERTYNLIKAAMDSACYYYNRYTPFKNNIWVYYNAGIPTAQASYHGSIGFGPNEQYMWVGTAMHEMAHYFGSGTNKKWQDLMVDGIWQGPVAQALCKQLTGQTLEGGSVHYWPTGINYKSEVKSKTDLINHTKVAKAMIVDDAKLPTSW